MSANELLERVKTLPPKAARSQRPVSWPDAAARRRKIFGDQTVPNLVLLARGQEQCGGALLGNFGAKL